MGIGEVTTKEKTKRRFAAPSSGGFDKNFHSLENKKRLSTILETAVLPKKGKLDEEQRIEDGREEFLAAPQQHPAVESGIHTLYLTFVTNNHRNYINEKIHRPVFVETQRQIQRPAGKPRAFRIIA